MDFFIEAVILPAIIVGITPVLAELPTNGLARPQGNLPLLPVNLSDSILNEAATSLARTGVSARKTVMLCLCGRSLFLRKFFRIMLGGELPAPVLRRNGGRIQKGTLVCRIVGNETVTPFRWQL